MHRKIVKGVYYIGVDDNYTELFENLWELPFGVSYNSYLIVDEKVVLIETVKNIFTNEWLDNIREIIDPSKIDYIILNHMEPDHTGSLPTIAEIAKDATIILSPRAVQMQESFYDVPLPMKAVEDLEELSIGKWTLKFIHVPFVHWPETMMTQLVEEEILFSCDAFGSYGSLNGKHFDDEINMELIEKESKRYLSTIITTYFKFVQRAIKKTIDLNIGCKVIAPSHGPIYRKNPMWVIEQYNQWSSPELENYVTIVYGSMYGHTLKLSHLLKKELNELGVEVKMHNISYSNVGQVITDSVKAGVIVIAVPTYDAHPFPLIWNFVSEMETKRFTPRPAALLATYGWQGGAVKNLKEAIEEKCKFELLEPIVRVRARPTEEDIKSYKELAKVIAKKVK
ncbi:MAG: FprA family A-type flavoprotein [Candidatus Thorarchaeota archaeon]